ncbi:MAG: hypothetical protein H0W62_11080 [Chitinophagales bacterium]|nr:hypothetical protein [Chitinophagales bacterium]
MVCWLLFFSPSKKACAQSAFIPLNDFSYNYLSRFEIKSGKVSDDLHFSCLPLLRQNAIRFLDSMRGKSISLSNTDIMAIEYLRLDNQEWSNDSAESRHSFLKYFYNSPADFYQYHSNDFLIKINPVFEFNIGKESASDRTLYINTRGVDLRGWISKKVGYYFFLTENQARFPLFVRERTDSFGALPNEGYYKTFGKEGVDFFDAKGYFDFKVAKFITVQFGHDKNFIGNGIRSLALSDFSEDYIFLKLQTQVWKFSYQNIFADMTGKFLRGGDQLLPKKFAAFHHLSINVTKFLNAGLWESVVFHRNNGFELQYLNPIIFYRSVEQLIGSPDNTMLGADYRINFLHHFSWYGQLMIDDLNIGESKNGKGYWGDKYGLQNGIKYIDAFDIQNFDLQLEWNHVRPYTYTHYDTVSSYTNYNQALAHPLGANFNEWTGKIRYQPVFPVTIQWRWTFARQGNDTSGLNYGANIFFPTDQTNVIHIYNNEVGQGVKTKLFLSELSAAWMIKHNLYVDVSYVYRRTRSNVSSSASSTSVFQAGVRMNIPGKNFQF